MKQPERRDFLTEVAYDEALTAFIVYLLTTQDDSSSYSSGYDALDYDCEL